METVGTTVRRRPINSDVPDGGAPSEGDENNAKNESDSSKDVAGGGHVSPEPSDKPKSGTAIIFKERLLTTASRLAFGGKYLGIALLFWLAGYFGFSFLWLVIGVAIFTWREYKRRIKQSTSEVLGNIAKDEKKFFQAVKDVYKLSGYDLPSWVYFPDTEKAEWLNRVLGQLWPYVCDYVQDTISEKVQESIRSSNTLLKSFKFTKLELGEKSPRIGGVKVYSDSETRRTEIIIDIQIIYQSDANIRVTINRLSAGIKDLTLRGLLRVELRPLISAIPLAGAVSVAFVQQPAIDFDLTNLGNLLDLPVFDSALRSAVSDCIYSVMVLPQRYVLKLADGVDISRLLYPLPKGVVRIHILEARNLEEKDRKILGVGGGSDPYVEVKVGRGDVFRTKTIEHSIDPVWNERFDAPVMDVLSSTIEITLYDDDGALTKADYLGSATIQMPFVYDAGLIDEWIPLSNVKHGNIHVKVEWLDLSDDPHHLTKAMEHAGKHDLNAAYLNMYIDSAKDLPGFLDGKYEPSPLVKISIPDYSKPLKTKIVSNTNNPVWEEHFKALVRNPRMEALNFKVKDNEDEENLGTKKVRIQELLEAPNMTIDEPFNLDNSGHSSQLNMRLTARLLIPRTSPEEKSRAKSKPAFVVSESSKSPAAKSATKPEKAEKEADATPKDEDIPPGSGDSTEDDSGLPETSSVNDFGSSFVDKNLALFVANSPTNRSNGFKPSRNSSLSSEMSSVTGTKELKERLDKRDDNGNEYPLGRLHLTLSHSSQNRKLYVEIGKAENLIVCDEDHNTSDPYVRMYLLPQRRGSQKRKTRVVKNNTSPVFNERFEYDVMKGGLRDHELEIAVKNKTGILSSEKVLMGGLRIKLADYNLEEPVSEWFPLQLLHGSED